ncbi:endonuclease/exonuclease/phosphatase family protein [Oceanibium sediminis]|uniref:endonuclease/exonuclease/phosphatase family protein n=1 Tax=Oceanibium sediminis TaxID=2026339 RepID=UPI000DD4D0DD|nr:endonuclease/exonuclease/phosphatase family protein [Oceanibium sediminis]
MRLATWNIEWFSALFDARDRLIADEDWSRRHDVTRATQADGIAYGIERLNADVLMVIEAPNHGLTQSTVRALEGFAKTYGLRQNKAIIGYANGTMQEIAALYDPDVLKLTHDPMETERAPRFDTEFRMDVDVDDQPDIHVFSKPPLELAMTAPGFPTLRLIGVHAKSKAPHKASDAAEEQAISIANRRKQLAQCVWLRRRIEDMLREQMPLIVMGDLNDGPGLDHYEKLFGRSSVEVVMGYHEQPETRLYDPNADAWANPRQGFFMGTARFYNRDFRRYVNAILDYVMVSPDIRETLHPRWRIWHPFDDPRIYKDAALRDALLAASDHFPVSIDLG